MISKTNAPCLFCRMSLGLTVGRNLVGSSAQNGTSSFSRLQSGQRGYASMSYRQRPSRAYDLSNKVAVPTLAKDRKGRGRTQQGPFAGMNRTRFDPDSLPKRITTRQRPEKSAKSKKQDRKAPREEGSFHALKMQQSLVDIGYSRRTATKQRITEVESFDQFDILPIVHEAIKLNALRDLEDLRPTPIQKLAIPAMLGDDRKRRSRSKESLASSKKEKQQFLLAAETGSGKTLAYMVPAVDAMKKAEIFEQEQEGSDVDPQVTMNKSLELFDIEELEAEEASKRAGRPRVVILVPTAELVDQVGGVAKSLSHHVKFRAALISSACSSTVIRNRLFSEKGIDLLVSTPTLLANIIKSSPSVMSRVSHLIIDEADSLLDRSFEEDTGDIIQRAMPSLTHLVMCSATIPKRMDNYLRRHYPDLVRLTTPNLHAIPRRVQLSVVDVAKEQFFDNKNLACADTIWNIGKQFNDAASTENIEQSGMKRIIVFVNEREKTAEVAAYLQAKGIDAIAFSRDMETRQQTDLIAEFTNALHEEQGMSETWQNMKLDKKLDQTRVLVTTDLASRGIDTTPVRDVILYDVPQSTVDFIHRLGRTGRMGRRGRAIVLVGKHDRRDVVSEVKHSMFRGQALI